MSCTCRVYDDPHHCDLWLYYQQLLHERHPGAVIAALQFYSDKTQVTFKGMSLHPVRGTLLNIWYGKRIHRLSILGYLPNTPPRPDGLTDLAWRQVWAGVWAS